MRSELIQPLGIRFSKDGKRGFVALGRANRIAVIDVEKLEVTNYILVGQRPWHMEMSPDGSKLYAANGLTNDVTIIDVATLRAEQSVPVGRLPWGIAIKPLRPRARRPWPRLPPRASATLEPHQRKCRPYRGKVGAASCVQDGRRPHPKDESGMWCA